MVEAQPTAVLEWSRRAARAHAAGMNGRLATAMTDFLLDPAERLSEQERALMTSMLAALIGGLAEELALRLGPNAAAHVDADVLMDRLRAAGLLGRPRLIALLLRRSWLIRSRDLPGEGGTALLQGFAGDRDPAVASAAMAVVLARASNRDRFGRPGLSLSDCDAETAVDLTYAVAAAFDTDGEEALVAAAVDLLARHDEGERLEALEARLVLAIDQAGRLDAAGLLAMAARGEVGLLAEALARIARIPAEAAWSMLMRRDEPALGQLLRLAEQPRTVAAGLIAALTNRLALADPASAIAGFDAMTPSEATAVRSRLRLPSLFKAARAVLQGDGQHRA
ncbi:DUF2336 domain-containing protein [Sphingomonas sp. BN140010]|uniref:DUF2336 domain-containing protein n=1 Tax=Sphingomonas arvum TaxID=2992113 RepID=A0ABT3JE25_9SPHN|nr:DUF2336 domain-containing protein [Sphingomonas sp. BN140010]MCW3797340.1 DUF2336 domain-containing protein [Sphingomonas sp. BN140010]